MQHMKILIVVTTAVMLAGVAFDADAQYRYRWVDETGATQISDRVPADAAKYRVEVLNNRGMVVRVMEAQMNEEERAEAARRAEEEAAAEAAATERARQDRVLLQSYTSVGDLERARDGRLQALAAQIRITQSSVANLQETVEELQAQVERLEQNDRPVPQSLTERLTQSQSQLEANQRFVNAREQEYADIEARFEADIERYKQLRGID